MATNHLSYYGLEVEPFPIMPLTQFYYHNEQHDRAFLHLHRALDAMKGLAIVAGAIGTGKSLLARRLLESLPEEEYDVSLLVVLHGDVDSQWLIRRIAAQFGVEHQGEGKIELIGKLARRLEEIASSGKKAAILLDEAHMLRSQDLLEEIRGLLNLELPDRKLLSIILFGMPELDQVVSLDPALSQRIAVRCELKPFSLETVAEYVRFRLIQAGSDLDVLSGESIAKIHAYSGGVPRLVNVICDNALFEGFVRKASLPLPSDIIDSVAEDLRLCQNS